MWIDQLYIFFYNLHGILSLTTPAVSSILMSTDNITSSKHNYDKMLNIHQYFPYHNTVLYAAQKFLQILVNCFAMVRICGDSH